MGCVSVKRLTVSQVRCLHKCPVGVLAETEMRLILSRNLNHSANNLNHYLAIYNRAPGTIPNTTGPMLIGHLRELKNNYY